MNKLKNFTSYSNEVNEGITDNLKRAGQWLWNLVKNQSKIPTRNKKYNPDTKTFEIIGEPQQVVKIYLPAGISSSAYKFSKNPLKENQMTGQEEKAWVKAQKTQDPEIIDVSAPELKAQLEYHFQNPEDGRPLLIWGAPGIGKTSIVKAFGLEYLKVPVIEVICSLMEPTDVAGLPGVEADKKFTDTKRSVNFLPMIWPLDNGEDGKGGIIFLDEINRAHPSVQAAMLKVVLDREIAGANYKIPNKWLILAAANRPEDEPGGMIRPMSFALANRFAQVNLISDPTSWGEWARSKGLSDDVVTFIDLMKEYFYLMPSDLTNTDTTMGVTPRAWAYAAKEYADRKKSAELKGKELSEEEIYTLFAKHVGKKTSSIITDFLETIKVWPTSRIAKVYNDPTDATLELPKKNGNVDLQKAYAAMYMIAKYKEGQKLTNEEFTNLITYLMRIDQGELAMSGLNLVKRIHPELKNMVADTKLNHVFTPFTQKYKGFMKEI